MRTNEVVTRSSFWKLDLSWEMAPPRLGLRPTISGMSSISKKLHESGLKTNRPLWAHHSTPPHRRPWASDPQFWLSCFFPRPCLLPLQPEALLSIAGRGCCPSATTTQAAWAPQLLGVGLCGGRPGSKDRARWRPHLPQGRRVQWPGVRP